MVFSQASISSLIWRGRLANSSAACRAVIEWGQAASRFFVITASDSGQTAASPSIINKKISKPRVILAIGWKSIIFLEFPAAAARLLR